MLAIQNRRITTPQVLSTSEPLSNRLQAAESSQQSVPTATIHRLRKKAKAKVSICINDVRGESTVLKRAVRMLHWNSVDEHERWDVYWSNQFPAVNFCRKMKRFQCINHFSGMYEICRKDLLARNLIYMQKFHPNEYNFFPPTWIFPYDYAAAELYAQTHPNSIFILKPVSSSMGRGIDIIKALKSPMRLQRVVCQLYIRDPLLLDGYKFDLRVYALIVSIDPLCIFVYNEGLVRLATAPYERPRHANIDNKFMHLTNYSINKHSAGFSQDREMGSKRMFESFNKLFVDEGHDVLLLWSNIDDIIIKTILTIRPQLKHAYRTLFPNHDRHSSACFEILGFDIIIDRMYRPYLLEVNQSPSFNNNTVIDDTVKTNLIRDTFTLLNISAKWRRQVLREDKEQVIRRNQMGAHRGDGGGGGGSTPPESHYQREHQETEHQQQQHRSPKHIDYNVENAATCLGHFRKLDLSNYTNLMLNESRPSIYNDTILSRTRAAFGQSRRRQQQQSANNAEYHQNGNELLLNTSTEITMKKQTARLQKSPMSHQQKHQQRQNKSITARRFYQDIGYLPKEICYRDEIRRLNELYKRDILVRNSGVVELISQEFPSNVDT